MKKAIYKNLIISIPLILFCIISCSNSQESKLVYTESNTIKQSVKDKEQDITWTTELEEKRLSQQIHRGSMKLGADVPYSKELYKINQKGQLPVYPSIAEFGSLDTTNLRPALKDKLDQFCTSFASEKHSGAESYFNRRYLFNYVFFVKDFEDGWKNNFKKEMPEESELFTKWIFGEPFIGADIMQIPVRFYADCGTIDMTVFLNSNGNNEFYQITIDRWQKV